MSTCEYWINKIKIAEIIQEDKKTVVYLVQDKLIPGVGPRFTFDGDTVDDLDAVEEALNDLLGTELEILDHHPNFEDLDVSALIDAPLYGGVTNDSE